METYTEKAIKAIATGNAPAEQAALEAVIAEAVKKAVKETRRQDQQQALHNTALLMENYRALKGYEGRAVDSADAARLQGAEIQGETDAMHMATVGESVTVAPFKKRPDALWLYRGLWEMTGDDMGGPFVSLAIPLKSPAQRGNFDCWNTVVEGFTFAPGKKKRNAMRELEALLYTVKVNKKSNKNQ